MCCAVWAAACGGAQGAVWRAVSWCFEQGAVCWSWSVPGCVMCKGFESCQARCASAVCMWSNLRLCILCLIAEEAHADRWVTVQVELGGEHHMELFEGLAWCWRGPCHVLTTRLYQAVLCVTQGTWDGQIQGGGWSRRVWPTRARSARVSPLVFAANPFPPYFYHPGLGGERIGGEGFDHGKNMASSAQSPSRLAKPGSMAR